MQVSGFTFVRNAIKYDYPVVESIRSILPLCDEVIVCVGNSEDDTLALIQSIKSPKIKIIESIWDDALREGGRVLAVETNKALDAVSPKSDWAIYIQADELIHEQYLDTIKQAMEANKNKKEVECLVLKYVHFYGNYHYVGDSRKWYRREVRIIKNNSQIRSYKDAQGFRKHENPLKGKLIDAFIYHYGWVKNPYHQQTKAKDFNKLWHSDEEVKKIISQEEMYDYTKINSLKRFQGTHPSVMEARIQSVDWDFTYDESKKNFTTKEKILNFIEKKTGIRLFEFRNYRLI